MGLEENEQIIGTYERMISLSKANEWTFPISVVHLMETDRITDNERRKNIAKVMIKLSKGATICPYTSVINTQIRNAVLKRFGLPTIELRKKVVRQGIGNLFGSQIEIKPNSDSDRQLDEQTIRELTALANGPEMLFFALSGGPDISSNSELQKDEFIQRLEEGRKKYLQSDDPGFVDRWRKGEIFVNMIVDEMAKTAIRYGLERSKLQEEISSREKLDQLLEDVPSAFVLHKLTAARDREYHRPIKKDRYL